MVVVGVTVVVDLISSVVSVVVALAMRLASSAVAVMAMAAPMGVDITMAEAVVATRAVQVVVASAAA
jgi:hypothetical protein